VTQTPPRQTKTHEEAMARKLREDYERALSDPLAQELLNALKRATIQHDPNLVAVQRSMVGTNDENTLVILRLEPGSSPAAQCTYSLRPEQAKELVAQISAQLSRL